MRHAGGDGKRNATRHASKSSSLRCVGYERRSRRDVTSAPVTRPPAPSVDACRPGAEAMTRNEELAAVIRLACQVESRTNVEQRALVALAWDCDIEHNKLTVTNRALKQPDWTPQDLVSLVINSRVL